MGYLFRAPAAIVEERGEDWLAPARPQPHASRLGPLDLVLAARHSLLSIWRAKDYTAGCGASRVFGRQVILVNSPATVKHVMVTAHENYERKSPQMRRALEHLLGDGLFISDGDTWKHRRPLVADIVNKSRVPSFAPTMEAVAAEMVERWARRPEGEVFDVLTEMGELTAEIIARAVFGADLGPKAAAEVIGGFASYQQRIDSFNLGYFLGLDDGVPILRGPGLRRSIAGVHRVIEAVIEDHLAGRSNAPSMIDLLVRRQQKDPKAGLDVSALRNEAATIFMAGHETTAATLTWAWYLIANAPWVEEALLAEIGRVCGDRAPSLADVPALEWCRAVIEETLRLYPPVPFLARQARGADRIRQIEVEPAALVIVSPWLLHRTEGLWDRPHHFLPERFMGDAQPQPYTYIPFSVGPRICAGINFGVTEAILCLASIAQRFRIRPVPGRKVEPVCRLSLRPLGGLPATAERR